MAASLISCGSAGAGLSAEPGGGKWVDSDVAGYVRAEDEIRLQDDFAAAVNQDWIAKTLLSNENDEKGAVYEADDLRLKRLIDVVRDESLDSENARILKAYADLVLDWESRNALGVTPLEPYVEAIQNISSVDELTDFQASPEMNPFNLGLLMPRGIDIKLQYPDRTTLYLNPPAYSLANKESYLDFDAAALEAKEKNDELCKYLLGRLGYTEKEADIILKQSYKLEAFLARHENDYSTSETLNSMETTRDKLLSFKGDYPLYEILDGRGYDKAQSLNLDYMYLNALNEIYNEENLENIKSFLIIQLINSTKYFLDWETFNKVMLLSLSKTDKYAELKELDDADILAELISMGGYQPLMDTLYLEKYFSDGKKEKELNALISDLMDSYRTMIGEVEWMSDETKTQALDKLDNMEIKAIRPDNTADYSGAQVASYADGGNLLDAVAEGKRLLLSHDNEKASDDDFRRGYWDVYDMSCSTTTLNSYYMPAKNTFFILAGFLNVTDNLYGEDVGYEEFLGSIGAVVGHEISHGFDASGTHYDKYGRAYDADGNDIDWMTTDDRSRLDERSNRLASYSSLARPVKGGSKVSGTNVMDEAIADMAGIKAILYLAKKKPDFDYDAFFKSYARMWRKQCSEEREKWDMSSDNHPLGYNRINISLQQYDEFIETYDIRPGDGMYLEKERRVNVW